MTPAQKQTTQYELLSEKKVMEQLERSYQKALEDVKDRLRQLDERTDEENRQAVAYQKAFQQGLQKQLERILGKLHSRTYRTVQEYLQDCYLTGHTAVLYELQSDGLRLSLPIPQDKVCQAAVNDTKLVKPLYDSIGEDFAGLKKHITDIVSAGFASGASYGDMANQITGKMIGNYATMRGGALGRAKLIVRTEGNRIANAARLEAARTAKQQGADLVKQWDSTMDRKTRPHHVQLDGQVRELDEPFEVDGRKAQAPGKFGIASEDINCRCHAYSRPRWAVRADSDYKYDNQHRALVKVSSESYAEYRAGYIREETEKRDVTIPHHDGHTAEVTPPTPKDNGGTGKTYSPEKITPDYMSRFTPKYSDQTTLTSGNVHMSVKKVANSRYQMYADTDADRKNKAVRLTEKTLSTIQTELPEDFRIPKVAVVDFQKHRLNPNAIAGYDKITDIMYMNSIYDSSEKISEYVNRLPGWFADTTEHAPILHELGHKFYEDCIKRLAISENIGYNESKKKIDRRIFNYIEDQHDSDFIKKSLSMYADKGWASGDFTEIIAECFSARGKNAVADAILALLE